ncbi:MAG: histidine kinase, partial [Bacteroidetes bacterium QH_2_63_10]
TASFYTDLLVAWVVGLVGWGLGLVVVWYLRLARREGLRRHRQARRAAAQRLVVVVLLAIGARYAMLPLDVPARWAEAGTGLAPLFDPTYLASTIGGGIFRSIGDLLLTGLWAGGLAVVLGILARNYRPRADALSELPKALRNYAPEEPHAAHFLGILVGLVAGSLGGVVALASVVRRAVLDSTLDFFSRTGLLPEPLVLGVLCGLFLLMAAGILVGIGSTWIALRRLLHRRPRRWPRGIGLVIGTVLFGGGIAALYLGTDVQSFVPLPYTLGILGGLGGGAVYGLVGTRKGDEVLTLRGLLCGLFAVTVLLYPLLYTGMDAKRQGHMVDAALSFKEGEDPRGLYSMRQVLRSASETLVPALHPDPAEPAQIDSIATRLLRQSLLSSLDTYEVRLSVLGSDGTVRRKYAAGGQVLEKRPDRTVRNAYAALRPVYERSPGAVIEQLSLEAMARPSGQSRFQYAGLLGAPPGADSVNTWILLRIEPKSLLPGTGFGVSRVLLPDG